MNLIVNGRPTDLEHSDQLDDLLAKLDLSCDPQGVAIAINDEVLQRDKWSTRTLVEGDRIEIIRAVQGG